jgi:nitroimidazol reductase NimA-like FMN-containing flavoprotein (pyridoxamine 5'-phosphate oxidase superfamily)
MDETPAPREHPTDRLGIEVLPFDACEERLEDGVIGRVAMVVAGEPVILPVNYRYVDGGIVFRTARGEKADAAMMHQPVAFEIDEWDVDKHEGWSVLVKGTAYEVDVDDPAVVGAASLRPWAQAVQRDIWVRIVPNEITGRYVR